MIFNSDKYIDAKLAHQPLITDITLLKPPNNKVPATNLTKLAPDRKIVRISVSKLTDTQRTKKGFITL